MIVCLSLAWPGGWKQHGILLLLWLCMNCSRGSAHLFSYWFLKMLIIVLFHTWAPLLANLKHSFHFCDNDNSPRCWCLNPVNENEQVLWTNWIFVLTAFTLFGESTFFQILVHTGRKYVIQMHVHSGAEWRIIALISADGCISESDRRLMPICSLLVCQISLWQSQPPVCANLIIYRWYHSRSGVKKAGKYTVLLTSLHRVFDQIMYLNRGVILERVEISAIGI